MMRHLKPFILAALWLWLGAPLTAQVMKDIKPSFIIREASAHHLPRFHFGRLKCAVNVNAWLRAHGKRNTRSAAAASFLRFPWVSSPRFGDVMYNRRGKGGGHAAIVLGKGRCLNPAQNRGWRIVRCSSIWPRKAKIFVRP